MNPVTEAISEATPIRIGLVVVFLGIFGSSVWWASSINTKLDTILSSQSTINLVINELKTTDSVINREIADLKTELRIQTARTEAVADQLNTHIKDVTNPPKN